MKKYTFGINTKLDESGESVIISVENRDKESITAVKLKLKGFNSAGDVVRIKGKNTFDIAIEDINVQPNDKIENIRIALPNKEIKNLQYKEVKITLSNNQVFIASKKARIKAILNLVWAIATIILFCVYIYNL